jgi:signal transduction histidine kinase
MVSVAASSPLCEASFLARIGEIFAASLDTEETLTRVAEASVEFMADWVLIQLVEDGELRRLKIGHADPDGAEIVRFLDALPLKGAPLSRVALETKQTQLVHDFHNCEVSGLDARRIMKLLEPTSKMFVPLIARDQAIGVITFIASKPRPRYDTSHVRLAEEIARRAALAIDNARLYKMASDAIAARDNLLAVVAHDLRNPLAAIQITAEMLLRRPSGPIEKAMDRILRSSERANRLIEDLLEVQRANVGRLELRREPLTVTRLVSDVAYSQRPLLNASGLDLELELEETRSPLWADPHRMSQVFENLLANAMKFTPRGGRITIGGREEASGLLFWVADTGPGIAADKLPHVFDQFWQSDGEHRGLGLGLTIAKHVVEAHGGQIWAESELDRGTRFLFTIPGQNSQPTRT